MSEFTVAIPARYGSTRLPAKALRELAGAPLIVHVARRALESGAAQVVVATDDERIAAVVAGLPVTVCMTSVGHASGTDRLAECARALGWEEDRIVVNLQGDEPLAPASGIRAVAACLAADAAPVATLAEPLNDPQLLFDPNCVKLVTDASGHALYFSRAPIPWARDAFAQDQTRLPDPQLWRRHIGIYAYRAGFLGRFAQLPPGQLERIESLEQLRVLEAGYAIAVAAAPEPFPGGVDTEADLVRVAAVLAGRGRHEV
ncbi:MAG TPA: 3-deoxy-manno-octulosonate cytidylyltransferase [Xanthomonadaceae bacterium]|nr:3-deoxy-manno-octulosonate cytidylyltransferase [Xanthomonadaceae bacterium]